MPRLTIDLSEPVDQLLAEQAKKKGITKAELIRRAVSSYATLSDEVARGRKVGAAEKNSDRIVKEIVLP
jgi:hypothetical protein